MNENEPDGALVRKAIAGDPLAFANLCEQYRGRVWRIVTSIASGPDAEDLAQEAIVRAFGARRTYRSEAPFGAWLCRIALNVAHDYQRSAWRRKVVLWQRPPGDEAGDAFGCSPDQEAEVREVQRRVRQAVAALPPKERVPIWLHYFEQFNLAEVARLEGVPESTVRSRVKVSLRRLHLALHDLAGSEGESLAFGADVKGYTS